ncbi:MAG: aldo/keto reductase [Nitrospirae bacterium]|nr:aldo/keto reductase [Nitrospirota bacterium]
MDIPKRKLGKTGVDVTILGLGGEGILRTFGYDKETYNLINRALDLGINYCESARAYSGSESYYGKALRERRHDIFLTSKSHARDMEGALAHLQETLKNMRTDHIDLWQVHDVRTPGDLREIFGPGGAIEAFVHAKERGMTRFIGVASQFDFDTVLLPVNPAEPEHMSFLEDVVPLANEKHMGVIGMKVYLRGVPRQLPFISTMKPFYDFALSQAVSTVVIGCDDIDQIEENVQFAKSFKPMPPGDQKKLISSISPYARELMMYKL